jgi:hypothetical protein
MHALCDTIHIVYDVSNRESFEALPRWLEELENYVPPEVVKVVVGNKLDKVKVKRNDRPSPPTFSPPTFSVYLYYRNTPARYRWQRARRLRDARDAFS